MAEPLDKTNTENIVMDGEMKSALPEKNGEVIRVEKEPALEKEKQPEITKEDKGDEVAEVTRKVAPPTDQVAPAVPAKDQTTVQIENILSDDLTDMFLKMPPDKQMAFKKAGEETAQKIKVMLDEGKFKARKVVDLIKDWLKMIPGVNKFFLEQEAKIKTDKILLVAEDEKRRKEQEV